MSSSLFSDNPKSPISEYSFNKEAFDAVYYKQQLELTLDSLSDRGIGFFTVDFIANELEESYDIYLLKCNAIFSDWFKVCVAKHEEPICLKNTLNEHDFSAIKSLIIGLKSTSQNKISQTVKFECLQNETIVYATCLFGNCISFFLHKNTFVILDDENMFETVCNALPFALQVQDNDGTLLYANNQFLTSELINSKASKLIENSDFTDNAFNYLPEIKNVKKKPIDENKQFLKFSCGSKKHVYEVWESTASNDSDYRIKTFADVTERNAYEKKLKRKQHQLEESQRIAHVGSWEYNLEADSFLCSDEFVNLLGYESESNVCIRRILVSLFSKEKRLEIVSKYRSLISSDISIYKNEITFRNNWGREIILLDTGRIIRDEAGKALRIYATIQDITETKKTNEELRGSREKLMSLLNALPDRVFVINSDSVFTEYYDNIPGVSSANNENYRGYRISDVFTEEIALKFKHSLQKTFETHIEQVFEYYEGEGLFERWYEVRTAICNAKEVVFLVREITQSRKSMQELIKAKQRAEESDNLKSAFLANISHEIRTPLNAMMGFSNILAEDSLTDEEKEKYLAIINKNADQLTSLFSDLLDISKIESGQLKIFKEQININSEFDKLYHQFIQYKKHSSKESLDLKLTLSLDDEAAVVIADETRFTQIISNLLTNALKFTDEGYVEFGYEKPAKGVLKFFVRDTGKGIPSNELETIFKRFRQSATNNVKKHGGTGLGLAISESLVNLMGGRLWVESVVDKGSTFWFTLPYSM